MNKNILVVGSGIGGLSAAIHLQNEGYAVTLLEKNSFLGGKTSNLSCNGFKFDLCATIPVIFDPYIELFKDINENIHDYIDISLIDPLYKVFFENNNSNYIFSSCIPKLTETISNIDNRDFKNYLSLISKSYIDFTKINNVFLKVPLTTNKDILKLKNIKTLINKDLDSTCYEYLKDNLKSELLINSLLFQSMYMGVSPYNSSSLFTILPLINYSTGMFFIRGGISSYIKSLISIFKKRGGNIKINSEVTKFIFNNRTCIGVLLKNNEQLFSDIVVCNADVPYALENLIPKELNIKNKYNSANDFSCSSFIMHLVIDKRLPQLSIHNSIISENFKYNIEAPFNGDLQTNPHLYVYCPTRINKTGNYELITINLRVPNLLFNNVTWNNKTIYSLKNSIINTLEKHLKISNLQNYIKYEKYITPLDFLNAFNSYAGAGYGINHSFKNLLFFRPQCKIKGLNNLYFVGASTHPGAGVSIVLNSSKIAVSTINEDIKKQQ